MSILFMKIQKQIYRVIAFSLFLLGVFSVNSACNLIYHQPVESKELQRFLKNENFR